MAFLKVDTISIYKLGIDLNYKKSTNVLNKYTVVENITIARKELKMKKLEKDIQNTITGLLSWSEKYKKFKNKEEMEKEIEEFIRENYKK